MTNFHEITDASDATPRTDDARVRFHGIVEPPKDAAPAAYRSFERWASSEAQGHQRRISKSARDLETGCRMAAAFIFCAVFIGWPLGTLIGHFVGAGAITLKGWSLGESYSGYVLFGILGPPAFWLLGYVASRVMSMVGAGEAIALAAQQFLEPDKAAIATVETVGAVVRGQMEALNAGIDDALIRLASAEAMIRQHVGAIEQAGAAVESRTTIAAERVASERARLIDLTETLNARADDFATAIAEKAHANIEALENAGTATLEAESRFDDRLARLEAAAQRALMSFDALAHALAEADEHMRATTGSVESSAAEVKRVSELAARIADAAAESAARNAANVGMFAGNAADRATKAADAAIETARREAERASESAVEFATRQSERATEAAVRAVDEIQTATKSAVEAAAGEAEKATAAAKLVSEAARLTSEAARGASEEVKKASDYAQKSAADAIGLSEAAAARVEARNRELAQARAALESENARLESLIDEQRKRADRLAEAIASQTERLSKLAENQLREQEAAARLAEAQAAIQQARAAEASKAAEAERLARLEAERLAKIEAERAAKAEADRLAQIEAEKQTKAAAEKAAFDADVRAKKEKDHTEKEVKKVKLAATPRKSVDASNVLELGAAPRRGHARAAPRAGAAAARLETLAEEIARAKPGAEGEDERRKKDRVSWSEILTATDDAEPIDLGAANRGAKSDAAQVAASNAMKIIATLQTFTLDLETRLYGEPPLALLERFERGDRNVFANRILRLNEADVKRRIRAESGRDKAFEKGIHDFLQGFEKLLEDATTSATADEELEEYLSSPLGRVYLLVGATVGYFA